MRSTTLFAPTAVGNGEGNVIEAKIVKDDPNLHIITAIRYFMS